jgi:hypothetical protein
MSLCVHCTKNNLKTYYQPTMSHNELQNLQICLKWHPAPNTQKIPCTCVFKICKHYVHWNVTTLTLMAKSFSIWLNTLFEWVLHPTPMIKHIYSNLECGFLKCQDHLFSLSVQSMIMARPVEGIWLIGHWVVCELISCLLMGEYLMISLVNLLVFITMGNF